MASNQSIPEATLLSEKIENLFVDNIPKGMLDFGYFNKDRLNLGFQVNRYNIENFIPYSGWKNNETQLKLILEHDEKNVIPY